jgi:TRAP-type C4-dicarboxylate transport system permease small subunit
VQELLYVLGVDLVVAIIVSIVAARAGLVLAKIERALTIGSTALIIITMCFITAEVFMRYVMNSPIPGHLELSSLFVPVMVFAAVSYTQSQGGHVGMTLIVDNLPPDIQNKVEIVTLLLTVFTCSILSYFSFKFSYGEYQIGNTTETPPYFLTWPSAVAVPIGYALISIRCYLQALHRIAPHYYEEKDIVHDAELLAEGATE